MFEEKDCVCGLMLARCGELYYLQAACECFSFDREEQKNANCVTMSWHRAFEWKSFSQEIKDCFMWKGFRTQFLYFRDVKGARVW